MNTVSMDISISAAAALWVQRKGGENPSETILRLTKSAVVAKPFVRHAQRADREGDTSSGRYEVLGRSFFARTANEAYLAILVTLSELEPTLMDKLAVQAKGNSRNHFSRNPKEVYPRRSDLDKFVAALGNGWFVGTNISNREKRGFLEMACRVLDLEFGKDVRFEPGNQ